MVTFYVPGGSGRYRAELLPNGYVRVDSIGSGSVGLWERNGRPHSGDLTLSIHADDIRRKVMQHFAPRPAPEAWLSRIA